MKLRDRLKREDGTLLFPNEVPSSWVEALIVRYSKPHDLVLDPMFRSGSVPLLCLQLRRRFVGCDDSVELLERVKSALLQKYQLLIHEGASQLNAGCLAFV